MNGRTQRNLVIAVVALLLLLAGVALLLLVRGRPPAPAVSVDAGQENAADPYAAEMNCLGQLAQRNDLDANQVGPAMEHCRGPEAGTNQASAP